MKIVSLQSVGLGTTQDTILSGYKYAPREFKVGNKIIDGSLLSLDVTDDLPKVTKIEFGFDYQGTELPAQPDTYFVHTSDGHIRVLPADKYIAEWSE